MFPVASSDSFVRRRAARPAARRVGAMLMAGIVGAGIAAPAQAQPLLPDHFQDVLVAGGLSRPVSFDFLPDGRVLVAEQKAPTRVRMVVGNALASTDPVLTVPNVSTGHNEQGLLAIAVDPDWPTRPYLYAYYTLASGPVERVFLTRYRASGDLADGGSGNLSFDPASAVHLINSIPDQNGNHNGGALRFAADNTLFLSIGEDAVKCPAQTRDDFRGKIVRLKVDHLSDNPGALTLADLVPPGNPFVGQGDIAALVWTVGLRNPFRFSLDPLDGALFVADVGENSQEEWSRVAGPGLNLGWPFYEGTAHLSVGGCPEPGGFTSVAPLRTYSHAGQGSLSAIDIGVYRTPAGATRPWHPMYEGDYFYTEYYQGFIVRLRRNGGAFTLAAPVPGQPSPNNWGQGLATPAEAKFGPDGSLWYVSQFGPGALRRIEYTGSVPTANSSLGALRARYAPATDGTQP